MSTNYKYQGTDLDSLLEPKRSFGSPNPDFVNYSINSNLMTNRFSRYGGRGWEKSLPTAYLYRGTPIKACYKGYKPSCQSVFYSIGGAAGQGNRDIYMTRTDSALSFSGSISVSFSASSFASGVVPHSIGILCCAGGGGAGVYKQDGKSGGTFYYGGGGGAITWFVLNFDNLPATPMLRLGAGGGSGQNGNNTYLFIGDTRIFYLDSGAMCDWGGSRSAGGSSLSISNTDSHVFAPNGEILDNSSKILVKGVGGYGSASSGVDEQCLCNVTFDADDSVARYGMDTTHVGYDTAMGGASLNGAMIDAYSNGTNGAGAGGRASSGGAGAAYFFY